jgi:hypothetical protein
MLTYAFILPALPARAVCEVVASGAIPLVRVLRPGTMV